MESRKKSTDKNDNTQIFVGEFYKIFKEDNFFHKQFHKTEKEKNQNLASTVTKNKF